MQFFVFDVESAGLHGEGFAVGYVVVDGEDGSELEHGFARLPLATGLVISDTDASDAKWLRENVEPSLDRMVAEQFIYPRELRDWFWAAWLQWKDRGAVLAADVAWPVEARFLARCVDDDRAARKWDGPYPLYDIASIRFARDIDALATVERLPGELPAHNPLADARQSARLLLDVVGRNLTNNRRCLTP